jgi:hypothetical protein
MKSDTDRHYKIINSKTGYAIFYHSLSHKLGEDEVKVELEKVKTQVAVKNNLFTETLYWEEIKESQPGAIL